LYPLFSRLFTMAPPIIPAPITAILSSMKVPLCFNYPDSALKSLLYNSKKKLTA
jgi:hypothetical protein